MPDCLQDIKGAESGYLHGCHRLTERQVNRRLRAKVIDFVGLRFLACPDKRSAISEVTGYQLRAGQLASERRIIETGVMDQAEDLVAFSLEEF